MVFWKQTLQIENIYNSTQLFLNVDYMYNLIQTLKIEIKRVKYT